MSTTNHRGSLRVAVAQPRIQPDRPADAKVDEAVASVEEAARRGAELVVFPEGYPGPLRIDEPQDPAPVLMEAARSASCGIAWSRIEPIAGGWETVGYLIDADGSVAARYPRSHPATGDVHPVLNGAPMHAGPDLVVATVQGVQVGLLVCSELWLPEVARVLVLRGAELLLAPAGGGFGAVGPNWQLMARARAIENQCTVALTQNRLGDEPGIALIAGPERDLAASPTEALVLATVDLERARWLRAQDDSMVDPKPFTSLPGLLRARRPELYHELVAPRSGLYDYRIPAGSHPGPAAAHEEEVP